MYHNGVLALVKDFEQNGGGVLARGGVVPDRRRHAANKIEGEKQKREADELSRGRWVGQSERELSA